MLDIRLPGIDGWEVLEALKADPATRGIPVVVVSILDERPRGMALGAAEYLVKPVGRETVGALRRVGALPAGDRANDAPAGPGDVDERARRSWWSRTTRRT